MVNSSNFINIIKENKDLNPLFFIIYIIINILYTYSVLLFKTLL